MIKALYKVFVSVLLLYDGSTALAGADVPVGEDLRQDGTVATEQQLPILLAFTAIDCSYCEALEAEFLQPMILGGEYEDRVIIRKVILDNGSSLVDFSGRQRAATSLSDSYRVFVTPTLLFVDAHGRELAGRILGFNTPELFGGYLDNCIETARSRLRGEPEDRLPRTCLENRLR